MSLSENLRAYDFAQVHSVGGMSTFTPDSIENLTAFLQHNGKPLAIKGAGYSHGGHILVENGVQIDMSRLKAMSYNASTTTITVMAGATWYDVIRYLSTFRRTVAEMQSYHSFSVGGSVGTNCHGRGLEFGTISDTIVALTVLTTDGRTISCSPDQNNDLFSAMIGGYGLVAILLTVTLKTVPNHRVRLEVSSFTISMMKAVIDKALEPDNVFFNANIYPPNLGQIVCYIWKKSNMPLTVPEMYVPHRKFYPFSMFMEQLVRRFELFKQIRARWEPRILNQGTVAMRSYAIAKDAHELSVLTRWTSTTILQEYFVPARNLAKFMSKFLPATQEINVINISLRCVRKADCSILNYAPENMIAIVIYFNMWNTRSELNYLTKWTNAQVDNVIKANGTFYLPYLLSYDSEQILKMYPRFREFMTIKKRFDKQQKLRGMFYEHIRASVA